MAEIIKFSVDRDDLIKLAGRASDAGDIPRAVELLKKAIALEPKLGDAKLALFHIYSDLGAFDIANTFAFNALSEGLDDETRELFFVRLALNYAQMDRADVADFYIGEYVENYDVDFSDATGDSKRDFSIVNGDEYCEKLVDRAYDLMREHRFDEAIELMDRVDDSSSAKDAANQIVLIALMLKNDIDAVIANAEEMLKKKDSLRVKTTLASAYMAEDREEEARRIVETLVGTEYTSTEDMLLVLPLLINFEMHGEIEKYCRNVLEMHRFEIHAMTWLAVALYNLGKKDEATRTLKQVEVIYGSDTLASYLLKRVAEEPQKLEYAMNLPESERIRRLHVLEEVMRTSEAKLKQCFEEDSAKAEDTRKAIEWAMKDSDKISLILVHKLSLVRCDFVEKLFKRTLLRPDIDYDLFSGVLLTYIEEHPPIVDLNVVALDRYKELFFKLPDLYFTAPEPLYSALRFALANVVITDDEPNEFVIRMFKLAQEVVPTDMYGEPIRTKRLQRIRKLKSVRTIVGTLLGKVYEEEESREDIIARYDLNGRTYDKYCKIFFGDDEDGEDKD